MCKHQRLGPVEFRTQKKRSGAGAGGWTGLAWSWSCSTVLLCCTVLYCTVLYWVLGAAHVKISGKEGDRDCYSTYSRDQLRVSVGWMQGTFIRWQLCRLVAGRGLDSRGATVRELVPVRPSKEFLNRRLHLGRLDLDYWRSGNIFDTT
jgi:hypothetical protein